MGSLCAALHDQLVRNLECKRIQVDEIWSFVGCKHKSKLEGKAGAGDCWVWVGMDADAKLIVSYLVGLCEASYAHDFVGDIADRIKNRIQLTSDGLRLYITAVIDTFGFEGVDYAQLRKIHGPAPGADRAGQARYSPGECIGCVVRPMNGDPDPKHISTSYRERMNLTTRMTCRRFTRLTNGFSKKWRNHEHAIALHYFVYNFIRPRKTLGTTPAVAAGLTSRPWTIEMLVALLVAREEQQKYCGRINRADRS